ncbi:N-myc-interactor isoform 1-T3 [Pholidichthys leucotaenia]
MDDQLDNAKKELHMWKDKVEKADDMKSRLLLEKMSEDDTKAKAQEEMNAYLKKQDECQKEFAQRMSTVQEEIQELTKHKQDLLATLKKCKAEQDAKKAETAKLKQKFKIYARIPDTEVKFVGPRKEGNVSDSQPIRGVFTINQRASVPLKGGQALITFEEEKVASQILKIAKFFVSCEKAGLDVKPKRITVDPAVKFEVHLDVSRKKLKFSNVPPSMPEEHVKDRLEMSFSRPSRGGGEVESVEYDKISGKGHITFLHSGVAENLALTGKYQVDLDSKVNAQVGPAYTHQLQKFQTFCGSLKRTILLDGIQDVVEEEDLQDHLEIHFQKPSNSGGEIECIKYISPGKALQAFFSDDNMETDN